MLGMVVAGRVAETSEVLSGGGGSNDSGGVTFRAEDVEAPTFRGLRNVHGAKGPISGGRFADLTYFG